MKSGNKSKAPLFTIGMKYRTQYGSREGFGVGPAAYNTRTDFNKTRGISFTKDIQRRDDSAEAVNRPGPSQYSVQTPKKIRGGKFGTSKRRREELALASVPGPGAYETISSFQTTGRSCKSGLKTARSKDIKTYAIETPGPGQYTLPTSAISLKRGCTMGVKIKENLNRTLPGPADYVSESPKRHKGGRIGTAKRLLNAKSFLEPSPQSYSPKLKFVKPNTPKFKFPSSRKAILIDETPGP